jgi:hypothetical protein
MEDDIDSDDDDSVVSVVDISAAKAGVAEAEVLQHTKKICNANSPVVHAGAIPDKNSLLASCCLEELSSWNGLFASSLVNKSVERKLEQRRQVRLDSSEATVVVVVLRVAV